MFKSIAAAPAAPITYWERYAGTTWGSYLTRQETEAIERALDSMPPGILFDIGCGEGRYANIAAKRGWHTTCTDIDEAALADCQKRNPGAICIKISEDDETLQAKDGSVDLIFVIEVPGVLEAEWFRMEAARVLKPSGMVLGVFHNKHSTRGLLKAVLDGIRGSFCFYRMGFSPWRRKLESCGLDMIHMEGLCWFPFSRTSDSRLVPYAVKLEKALGLRKIVRFSPWVVFIAQKQDL